MNERRRPRRRAAVPRDRCYRWRAFKISQVTVPSSRVDFTYARNRISLPATRKAIAAGDDSFRDRKLDDALAHFMRAAAIDNHDPQPHLRAADIHLHLRQFAEAVAAYRATE